LAGALGGVKEQRRGFERTKRSLVKYTGYRNATWNSCWMTSIALCSLIASDDLLS
jgi:hypothetical protein